MSKINWLKTLNWTDEQLEDLRYIGYAYIRQGKYDIGIAFYEALNVLEADNAYDAQTLGALYLEINQPAKAMKLFDKALKIEADHAPTLLNMCKALFMLGRKDEALKLANILKNEPSIYVSNVAKALLLAYG
ncbi:MAG: tetratricopeptide repeat protein [Parachlamydiaceae bacterium]|nr:tetratricopeptide repeat protein [Parachlamydiaceae bacterium]